MPTANQPPKSEVQVAMNCGFGVGRAIEPSFAGSRLCEFLFELVQPLFDAFVIDTDVAAVEILQGVKTKIRLPSAPGAVNDGLAARVQACRAQNFLDTVSRYKIFGIVVAQN